MPSTIKEIYALACGLSREEQIRLSSLILNNVIGISGFLPEPEPEKNIGWHSAVADTFGKASFKEVDIEAFNLLFSNIENSNSLFDLASKQQISIKKVILQKRSNKNKKTTISDYEILIELKNETNEKKQVVIPKGQVFENKNIGSGFQNIVNAEGSAQILEPQQQVRIRLPGHCLNRKLTPPVGQEANVTPLKVNFEFDDQNTVWDNVDKIVLSPRVVKAVEDWIEGFPPFLKVLATSIWEVLKNRPRFFFLSILFSGGFYFAYPYLIHRFTYLQEIRGIEVEVSEPDEKNSGSGKSEPDASRDNN